MNKPTCETCDYWDEKMSYCRRFPQQYKYTEGMLTRREDWCGEHPDFSKWQESKED